MKFNVPEEQRKTFDILQKKMKQSQKEKNFEEIWNMLLEPSTTVSLPK